jgi:uncharacterized BrkB/YihY/UPF0761 family membrane protein
VADERASDCARRPGAGGARARCLEPRSLVAAGLAAFGNRAFRIGFHTVRGIMAHRLGLQAAALTYYTVFAMVPMLVVALWILKAFDWLPAVSPSLPANVVVPSGNQLLQAMLGMIWTA